MVCATPARPVSSIRKLLPCSALGRKDSLPCLLATPAIICHALRSPVSSACAAYIYTYVHIQRARYIYKYINGRTTARVLVASGIIFFPCFPLPAACRFLGLPFSLFDKGDIAHSLPTGITMGGGGHAGPGTRQNLFAIFTRSEEFRFPGNRVLRQCGESLPTKLHSRLNGSLSWPFPTVAECQNSWWYPDRQLRSTIADTTRLPLATKNPLPFWNPLPKIQHIAGPFRRLCENQHCNSPRCHWPAIMSWEGRAVALLTQSHPTSSLRCR